MVSFYKLNQWNLRRIGSWVWSLGELLMNHCTYRWINHEFILVKLNNNITSPIMLYDDFSHTVRPKPTHHITSHLHVITNIDVFCNCRRRFLMLRWETTKLTLDHWRPLPVFRNIERFLTKIYCQKPGPFFCKSPDNFCKSQSRKIGVRKLTHT